MDLDGTFLNSKLSGPDPLYEFIEMNRENITLIYASGRALESIFSVLYNPTVPSPDYIIGDVGATIVEYPSLNSIPEIQSMIDDRWPGTQTVLKKFSKIQGLERQSVPQERRCSYRIQNKDFNVNAAKEIAEEINCDILISDDLYFDVLPRDISKGSTLSYLMELKNLQDTDVLVAGDTMNDFSMFNKGYNSVAVGGSEEKLIHRAQELKNSYIAEKPGTLGILEALHKFEFIENHPDQNIDQNLSQIAPTYGKSELVIVYHRQPFDEIKKGKNIIRKLPESPNGIIPTLLGFFSNDKPASWVAWSKEIPADSPFEVHVKADPGNYPGLTTARVPLSNEDVSVFYKKFSKEAFWPVIFSFPEKVIINHAHWKHYKKINKLFAEQAAREAKENAIVWIHDYNLWLVPGILKQLRPDVKIAFFHHTSFPSSDIFNILPWKQDIIASLIQCDHIGFHIPRYAENFVDVLRSNFPIKILAKVQSAPKFMTYGCSLGIDEYSSLVEVENKTLSIGAHPVGIDLERINNSFKQKRVQESLQKLEKEFAGQKLILSVERLDYVKGPIEKVEAFEMLLDRYPELHEKIVLINIVTPPAPGMDIYKSTREKLDQIIGRINGRFSKLSWIPIRYFYKSFPFEDLLAFYALSDLGWITPLRDGLNLVCKEYIAVKDIANKSGTLVLSEFAGASVELHGALLTNPFDKEDMVTVLYKALNLDSREQYYRQKQLSSIIKSNDVNLWGKRFIDILSK